MVRRAFVFMMAAVLLTGTVGPAGGADAAKILANVELLRDPYELEEALRDLTRAMESLRKLRAEWLLGKDVDEWGMPCGFAVKAIMPPPKCWYQQPGLFPVPARQPGPSGTRPQPHGVILVGSPE